MRISLKSGEKLYLNGAVFCVDRKVSIELLNDATFLLEAHILQAEDANTPLRRVYFAVQLMLMDPASSKTSSISAERLFTDFLESVEGDPIVDVVGPAHRCFREGRLIETLKKLRALFSAEQALLAMQ